MRKYIVIGGLWFDKINGNTFHNAKIIDCENGNILYSGFKYGYDSRYMETAKEYLQRNGLKDFDLINGGYFHLTKNRVKNGWF